jgi:PAS domain S-box-containing protein
MSANVQRRATLSVGIAAVALIAIQLTEFFYINRFVESVDHTNRSLIAFSVGVAFNLLLFSVLLFLFRRKIAQRDRAEQTLRESEEQFKQLVQHAGDIIYRTDSQGRFTFINAAVEGLMGYQPEELLGRHFLYPVSPSWQEKVAQFYRQQFAERTPHSFYFFPVNRKDGSEMWVGQNVQLIIEQGRVVAAQAVARDVTQRLQMVNELGRTRDAALESARLKSEFLANMSHEIRTPMNGVIGMASLLADTKLDEDQRHFVDGISQSADALLGIINDILDFSKIEAGKLEIEAVDFDLRRSVEGIVNLFTELVEAKNLELTYIIEAGVPNFLQADASRIRQILINLLGNAVKFTTVGEVALTVTCPEQTDSDAVLRFEVRDTGIGISAAAQARLFSAFVQADGSTSRRFGGSGLGLAISKQLVEAMGGEIGLESRPGEGSTFWFTLKAGKQVGADVSESLPQRSLQGLRALIVDDQPTNREVLSKLLISWLVDVTEADSFEAALDTLRSGANSGKPFDFALIDHQIHGANGLDLGRAILHEPEIAPVRLILLSSFGQRSSETTISAAGFRAWLTKPVRQSQLYDCLVNVMSEQFPSAQRSSRKPLNTVEPASTPARTDEEDPRLDNRSRLLVVEDNAINQEVARYQIEKIGYRVDIARDGPEALEMIERHEYALVLMDCQLPGMDGFETTAIIRRRADDKRLIPIIAVTASASAGEREKCLRAGMNDFLLKPFRKGELSGKIVSWLTEASHQVLNRKSSDDESPSSLMPDVTDRLRELEEDYGEEMVLKVIRMFIPDAEARIAQIDQAIKQEDCRALEQAAHGLKSGAANIGATEMSRLCEQLETQGELGVIGDAPEIMKKLVTSWTKVGGAITQYRAGSEINDELTDPV